MESWREELYHHGILGQKWGVRRYQNKDGSLTSEGKKRRSNNESGKGHPLRDKRKAYKQRVASIQSMSDADLNARIDRLEKEKRLKSLEKERAYKGEKAVEEVLSTSGKQIAGKLLTAAGVAAGAAVAAKLLSDKEFAGTMVNVLLGNVKKK